jgi:hypothetical protein
LAPQEADSRQPAKIRTLLALGQFDDACAIVGRSGTVPGGCFQLGRWLALRGETNRIEAVAVSFADDVMIAEFYAGACSGLLEN